MNNQRASYLSLDAVRAALKAASDGEVSWAEVGRIPGDIPATRENCFDDGVGDYVVGIVWHVQTMDYEVAIGGITPLFTDDIQEAYDAALAMLGDPV